MIRLLIDLQSCQSGSKYGGIGRYSLELAKAMANSTRDRETLFLLNGADAHYDPNLVRSLYDVVPHRNIVTFSAPSDLAYNKNRKSSRVLGEILREKFIDSLSPDCVHISSLFEGLADDVVMTVPERSRRPNVVTLYDLIPLVNEKKYLTDQTSREHYFEKLDQLKRADLLLSISEYSRQEGTELLKDRRGEIVNIRGGVDQRFVPASNPDHRPEDVVALVGDVEYLLYTASFDQRKNHERLIEAFAIMVRSRGDRFKLVVVGNGWPQAYERLFEIAARCGLPRSAIVFTGKISDNTLLHLYQHARLFVFPSLWEGLGLPVLEAMACGTPAIGSDTTSVPEVVGRPDALFDPADCRSIAGLMTRAAYDEDFNRELGAFGVEHVKNFTWQQSAKTAWTAIEKLVATARSQTVAEGVAASVPERLAEVAKAIDERDIEPFIDEASHHLAVNELEAQVPAKLPDLTRIAWITSWGGRCGIAAYAQSLINSLPECQHTIYASINGLDDEIAKNIIRCWRQRGGEDLYKLGELLGRDDSEVVHIQFNFGFFHAAALNALVRGLVLQGKQIVFTLHATQDPPSHIIADTLADYRPSFELASAIVAHSDRDIERLSRIGMSRHVWRIPQPLRPILRGARDFVKRRRFRVASYGFFLPNKGLPELIDAFAILRQRRTDVDLLLANASYGDAGGVSQGLIEACRVQAEKLGLEDEIIFRTEFVKDSESADLLSSADVIVFPYQATGESSSAAVRMGLALQKPVLTTPLDIFHDVREVTYVMPGTAPEAIAEGMSSVIGEIEAQSPRLEALKDRVDNWRWRHSQGVVADQHRRLVNRVVEFERWQMIFEADLPSLPVQRGRKATAQILSDADDVGLIAFGPYIHLDPGLYRLDVACRIDPEDEAGDDGFPLTLEIVGEGGARAVAQKGVSATEKEVSFTFFINEDCQDTEIRFHKAQGYGVCLSGYNLSKRCGNELTA